MRTKTSLLLLSALATLASPLVKADTMVAVESEVVNYEDLRLISTVGAAVLYGRIRGAAERVCGGPLNNRPVGQATRVRGCVDDAIAKAVAQVNAPILTQYHEAKLAKTSPKNAPVANDTSVAKAP